MKNLVKSRCVPDVPTDRELCGGGGRGQRGGRGNESRSVEIKRMTKPLVVRIIQWTSYYSLVVLEYYVHTMCILPTTR